MARVHPLFRGFQCCLAILFAGVLLEPISSRASPPQSPTDTTVPSCDTVPHAKGTLEHELLLTLGPDDESVSFRCSLKEQATLDPEEKTNVYNEETCSKHVVLKSVFAEATLQEEQHDQEEDVNKTTYKLTVPKNSRKTTETVLYYKCKLSPASDALSAREIPAAEPGKECKVEITVQKVEQTEPPPESDDEQQASIIECGDPTATKEANVSAESPLSFKCGAGMSLHPTNLTDVFDDQDGKCAAEVALQTLVDATLTKTDAEATHNEQPVYRLVVKTAPFEDTALCYKCVPSSSSDTERQTNSEEGSPVNECLLKISVTASATSAFPSARGAAQTAVTFFVAAQLLRGMVGA